MTTETGSGENSAPQGEGAPGTQQQAPATGTETGGVIQQQTSADGKSWIAGFQGEELGWLQNRGLHEKTPEEAIKNLVTGYRNAEQRLGTPADRLLKLPQDRLAEGAMDEVWKALGRPDDAAGYEFDGGDSDLSKSFAEAMSKAFHGAGISKDQGKAIEKALEDFLGAEHEKTTEGAQLAKQTAMEDLKKEWGGEETFAINLALAKDAAKALGMTPEEMDALEDVFGEKGNATVLRFLNRIGQKRNGEAPFIGGDNSLLGLGATTPEAAKAKISEMKSDPRTAALIRDSHLHPDNADVKRYKALIQLAAKGA